MGLFKKFFDKQEDNDSEKTEVIESTQDEVIQNDETQEETTPNEAIQQETQEETTPNEAIQQETQEDTTPQTINEYDPIIVNDEYMFLLKRDSLHFLDSQIDSFKSQRKMIDMVSKVIPALDYSFMPADVQNMFESNSAEAIMSQAQQGSIGYAMNIILEKINLTDLAKTFSDFSNDELKQAFIVLDFYYFILKDEYKHNIKFARLDIAQEIKDRGVELSQNEENLTELEILQRKCLQLISSNPDSEEIPELKKQIGKLLLEADAIWVAYDNDFNKKFPYISIMGLMEIFTKEEYAFAAQKYFKESSECNITIRKVENKSIAQWFDYALYIGGLAFNLDNGICPVKIDIEDFIPYKHTELPDRRNRDIRGYLLIALQALARQKNMPESKKQEIADRYTETINVTMSRGITSLINNVVYILINTKHVENLNLYSAKAFEKYKNVFLNNYQSSAHVFEMENEKTLPLITKSDEYKKAVSAEQRVIGTVKKITSIKTVTTKDQGEYIPVFTDCVSAEQMRLQFKKHGNQFDFAVAAMYFDEIMPFALKVNGVVVDINAYSYLINKNMMNEINQQMEQQKK